MGGDLGGTEGTVPKKICGKEDGPCILPFNIWRSSIKGCAGKVRSDKKGEIKDFFLK